MSVGTSGLLSIDIVAHFFPIWPQLGFDSLHVVEEVGGAGPDVLLLGELDIDEEELGEVTKHRTVQS